jgi:RNA polymerase-binding transcription factor
MKTKTKPMQHDQSRAIGDRRYEELKRMLISGQRELLNELHGRIRSVRADGSEQNRAGLDPDDTSGIAAQDDLQFALIEMKAETAKKIDVALRRLEEGTYGLCVECGYQIAQPRLRALPFAARCKDCEEAIETSQERDRARARRASSPLGFEMRG